MPQIPVRYQAGSVGRVDSQRRWQQTLKGNNTPDALPAAAPDKLAGNKYRCFLLR
ncbi:hypothetical protein GCM10027181_37970 [Rheinheimera gaetbuli]